MGQYYICRSPLDPSALLPENILFNTHMEVFMKEIVSQVVNQAYKMARMVDVKKVVVDENPIAYDGGKVIEELVKQGVKAKYDVTKSAGTMYISGLGDLKFQCGGENFYIDLPKYIFTKFAPIETIKALKIFGKVINNYGGHHY